MSLIVFSLSKPFQALYSTEHNCLRTFGSLCGTHEFGRAVYEEMSYKKSSLLFGRLRL